MSSAHPSRRRLRLLRAALALASTVLTLLALEAGLRIRGGGLFAPPHPSADIRMVGGGYPAVWHPQLGYAPEPGRAGRDNVWGRQVSIDAEGLRSNGGDPPAGPALLAVGDSFVFGDEVDDRNTWPAALERRLGRRVRNGGVFGYGLDQIVLRAEALLARHPVETLVVSVIPDDVLRCEYAFRFAHKPWFDLEGGALVLHNVPTPQPTEPPPGDSPLWRLLSRSALFEFAIHRLDPLGRPVRGSVRVHHRGIEVSSALIDRLANAAVAGGHELLLVAAWHPGAQVEHLAPMRRRALELGVPVLDLEPQIRRSIEERGGDWTGLFQAVPRGASAQPGHMTPLGNGLVADAIATRLGQHS